MSLAKDTIVRSKLMSPHVPFIFSVLFIINWPDSGLLLKRGAKLVIEALKVFSCL